MPGGAGGRKAAFVGDQHIHDGKAPVQAAVRARAPGLHGAPCAHDQPDFAVACGHGGVGGRGDRLAARVRMIMADDLGPARPRRLVRGEKQRGVDLEAVARIGRDIGGGRDGIDPERRPIAQQQPAAFMAAGGIRLALDRLGQSPR